MKIFIIPKTIIVLILIYSLSLSCSKFEDGPTLSFISAKARISREWKVEYVKNLSTGITHSADYEGWLFTLDKNGSFIKTEPYNLSENTFNGEWELIGKNILRIEYIAASGSIIEFYKILRLTKKELWLEDEIQEIHYYSE